MQTVINSPQTRIIWATKLAAAQTADTYFNKFIGEGEDNIIQTKTELEDAAGDRIRFDIRLPIKGEMTEGDNRVEGNEVNLSFYQDEVRIDQARIGTSSGGAMARKKTVHNLREQAKTAAAEYVAQWHDDLFFTYLSGDDQFAATNVDTKVRRPFAGNPVEAPDADHQVYGGAATSKATLTAADTMNLNMIDRLSHKTKTMARNNPDVIRMSPVSVGGGHARFVLLISPNEEYALRTETGDRTWSKVAMSIATAVGRDSELVQGGLGIINDTVVHVHEKVRVFNGYGAGGAVPAARCLLMGRQAGVVAYGGAGGKTRFKWVEKKADADNLINIYPGVIMGVKKTRFNGRDHGVIAVDVATKDPNA